MCITVVVDTIYNLDDLDELTAAVMMSIIFCFALIRLFTFSLHQKDMLYVVETMRKDWTCSS